MPDPTKVLIIDDEEMLRLSLRNYFEDEGYQVFEAPNGAVGVETCQRELPDLVLTDLRMPLLDGFGVIEHLKQALPELPIIVVSGQGTLNDVITAIRMGAWDYVTKPILRLDELTIVVQRVLERSRLLRDNADYRKKLELLIDDNATYQEHLEDLVHKRTEQLKEAATKYQIVADNTHSWEFWIAPEGHFIYSSPSCQRITGYPAETFIVNADLLNSMIHPEDAELFRQHRNCAAQRADTRALEFRIVHPDGSTRWIHHNCRSVFDSQGTYLGIRGSNRDITERKEAEEAHLKSEQRLSAIFDFLPDATWAIDSNGIVIAWNKACEELTGIPAASMLGKGDYQYAVPFWGIARPMLIDQALRPTLDLLTPYVDQYTEFCIDGGSIMAESTKPLLPGSRFLWWKAARLYDAHGTVTGAIESVRDITELRLSKEAALASSRAKSAFLATMSHELRTPLNAIIGFTDLIYRKGCGELSTDQEEYLGYVLESSKHLLALINDILDLTKIEAGKMELTISHVDIRSTLESSLIIIKERSDKNQIQVISKIAPQLPEKFYADAVKFKQVLYNLLSNAVKFTPQGGAITLTATQVTSAELTDRPACDGLPDGTYLLLSVIDTGIGIKPSDLTKIFEPFEQADNSSTRRHEGTGLGLHLSRMLVELHGGRIWAETNGNEPGSTFHVILPVTKQPPPQTQQSLFHSLNEVRP